jgi:hypothetical protein
MKHPVLISPPFNRISVHLIYCVIFVSTIIREKKILTLTSSLITPVARDVAFSERYLEEDRN